MTKFSNTRDKKLTEEEREQYRQWGREGGKRVHEIYGSGHMAEIGTAGAAAAKTSDKPKVVKIRHKKVESEPAQDDNLGDFI